MFIAVHNEYGNLTLINTDRIATVDGGGIILKNGKEITPREGMDNVFDALKSAELVIEVKGNKGNE